MADTKVFEKSDLLAVYDGSNDKGERVGTYRTRRTTEGLPPRLIENTHHVYATTVAYFSENLKYLIVAQHIYVTDGGTEHLPTWHLYRSEEDLPHMQIIRGLYNSADIHKRLEIEVKAWKRRVELDLPADYPSPDEAVPAWAQAAVTAEPPAKPAPDEAVAHSDEAPAEENPAPALQSSAARRVAAETTALTARKPNSGNAPERRRAKRKEKKA